MTAGPYIELEKSLDPDGANLLNESET